MIKAALATIIGDKDLIAQVMEHAKYLPRGTCSASPFGTPLQLRELQVNVRNGLPVVAPRAAARFGDLASWVVENKFEGKFRAGIRWEACNAKTVSWLESQLENQVSCSYSN